MNIVVPIKDKDKILDLAHYLKDKNVRDYVMFMIGIYTGMEITEILKLKAGNIRNNEIVYINNDKSKRVVVNQELKPDLDEYIRDKNPDDFLFKSSQNRNVAMTRQQAYNILHEAGNAFGIENVGTLTLRKTFGYHIYRQTNDIALVMAILNQSDTASTFRYIGVKADQVPKKYERLTSL